MKEKITKVYRSDSAYIPFLISLATIGIAYGLYKGVIDNYFAEIAYMSEFDRGVTEFFRELPGFCLVAILALMYMLSAEEIYKLGLLVMIVGMGMHVVIPPDRVLLIIATCIFALGEHLQLGMKSTISLEYAKEGHGGESLGFISSMYEIGKLAGYFAVMIAFCFVSGITAFRTFFGISTAILCCSMYFCLKIKSKSETDKSKSRFYFRKKFTKYYCLELFYGARKQVFFTFGPYVLILFYGASASVISLLFAVSAIACFIMSPVVGMIIDKVGYKIVMISDTLILVIVCFFYGFAHHIFPRDVAFVVCCVNYVLDSVISLAAMASNVYVQDLSDSSEEMKATISTGVSVNHFITILIALFGGWIWKTLGIEALFILSAVLGLCNSAYAATIKVPQKAE